jgi:DNA/RNA endonuclease YhcR with UshA esterase domain
MSHNVLPVRLMRHFPLLLTLLLILTTAPGWAQERLTPEEALTRVGESATVCGVVASARYAAKSKGSPTFLNLGKPYPQHVFTAIIWGSQRPHFSYQPETLQGRSVCITGSIAVHKGIAQIEVSNPQQIVVAPAR